MSGPAEAGTAVRPEIPRSEVLRPEMLRPGSEADVQAVVRDAAASRRPFEVAGSGSKAAIGRPVRSDATLSAAALTGITLIEPAEMVVAARAGTPVGDVVAALDAVGQHLTFEPADYRPLLGSGGEPTIGGVAAANVSGPRRIQAGAARDSLIGLRFVNGRGEAIKSGGRVMKNVTGLDLVKLLAGSWGTLGVLTEVTFKVLPRPEASRTLVWRGLEDRRAVELLSAALGSPFDVTGAAHLSGEGLRAGDGRTLVRLEGLAFSVDYRIGALRRDLRRFGHADLVDGEAAASLWRGVRDVGPFAEDRGPAVWRVSTAPTRGPAVAAAVAAALPGTRWFFDWGGGLVWLACDPAGDAGAAAVRAALGPAGGHATLLRAPAAVRAAAPVFQPMSEALRRLTAGVKSSLDPAGLFNPGRMYADI